jgi:hypothetical protein
MTWRIIPRLCNPMFRLESNDKNNSNTGNVARMDLGRHGKLQHGQSYEHSSYTSYNQASKKQHPWTYLWLKWTNRRGTTPPSSHFETCGREKVQVLSISIVFIKPPVRILLLFIQRKLSMYSFKLFPKYNSSTSLFASVTNATKCIISALLTLKWL